MIWLWVLGALWFFRDPQAARSSVRVRGKSRPRIVVGPTKRIVVGPTRAVRSIKVQRAAPMVVSRTNDDVVVPLARSVWDAKGWRRSPDGRGGHVFEGYYETGYYETAPQTGARAVRFAGRIVERSRTIDTYIADPPPAIKDHPKGPCFALVEDPWFKVHWHRGPRDVDSAILYVERVLAETLNR